jgi:hypothetical protein
VSKRPRRSGPRNLPCAPHPGATVEHMLFLGARLSYLLLSRITASLMPIVKGEKCAVVWLVLGRICTKNDHTNAVLPLNQPSTLSDKYCDLHSVAGVAAWRCQRARGPWHAPYTLSGEVPGTPRAGIWPRPPRGGLGTEARGLPPTDGLLLGPVVERGGLSESDVEKHSDVKGHFVTWSGASMVGKYGLNREWEPRSVHSNEHSRAYFPVRELSSQSVGGGLCKAEEEPMMIIRLRFPDSAANGAATVPALCAELGCP